MTGPQESKQKPYARLRQLPLEKLMELLAAAPIPSDSPEDRAYTDALEEAIIERETECPTGLLPDVDAQWAEFQAYYHNDEYAGWLCGQLGDMCGPPEPVPADRHPKRRRLFRTLAAAAVVCAAILMVPPALGYESVFHMLAKWTEDQFWFVPNGEVVSPQVSGNEAPQNTVTKDYESLQAALDAYDITEAVAPTWIPEGFVLKTVKTREYSSGSIDFNALYEDSEGSISILVAQHKNEHLSKLEKDANPVDIYTLNEIDFYIFTNNSRKVATWQSGDLECMIQGDLSESDIKMMIDSIYER